jgi:hypothetical protein
MGTCKQIEEFKKQLALSLAQYIGPNIFGLHWA